MPIIMKTGLKDNYLIIIVFSALALLGNYLSLPVFFGVDFIFGSIIVMLAIAIYGNQVGFISAFIAGLYTLILWGHPYALIIFTLEAIVVGYTYHRYKKPLVILDMGYWLLIGIPLVLLFYTQLIGLNLSTAVFIAFKQSLNGVFNTLIAGLMVLAVLLFKDSKTKSNLKEKPSITNIHFYVLLTLILVSGGVPVVLDSYQLRVDQETFLNKTMKDFGQVSLNQIEGNKYKNVNEIVIPRPPHDDMGIALVDKNNKIIKQRGEVYSASIDGTTEILDSGISIWLPDKQMPVMKKWKEGRYYVSFPLNSEYGEGYKLVFEKPSNYLVKSIENNRLRPFLYLASILLIGLVASHFLSKWLTRSTTTIAKISDGLSEKILNNEKITIPDYPVYEYSLLSLSFRTMSENLNTYFDKLKTQTTELEEAIIETNRANEEKSRFLANMSHELRTPMHAIMSFSNLGSKRSSDEKIKGYFEKINVSGARLTNLVDDLLDLSKLEAGKLELDIDEHDLTSITLSSIDQISSLLNEKNINIDINTDKPLKGYFDRNLITQVIINILSNAIKFSPENSSIYIVIGSQKLGFDKLLFFKARDEGVGIPHEEIDSIFNSFVQSSKTRTETGGTGLGLPISKELIELHKGKIWAESPPPGMESGSEFIFQIPSKQPE